MGKDQEQDSTVSFWVGAGIVGGNDELMGPDVEQFFLTQDLFH